MLVAHDGDPGVLSTIITGILRPAERVAILARRTDTIDALKGAATCEFPGRCKLAAQLSSAANLLPRSASKAGQLTSFAALAKVFLDDYYPNESHLGAAPDHATRLAQSRLAPAYRRRKHRGR
jgi:hypothetical protein